jgi:hypothetical protein
LENSTLNSFCLSQVAVTTKERNDRRDRNHQHHFLLVGQTRQCLASAIQRFARACYLCGFGSGCGHAPDTLKACVAAGEKQKMMTITLLL